MCPLVNEQRHVLAARLYAPSGCVFWGVASFETLLHTLWLCMCSGLLEAHNQLGLGSSKGGLNLAMPQPGGPSDSGGRSGGRAPRPNHEAPSSRGGLRVESIRAGHHKVSCWTLRARGLTAKSAEFALARC